MLEVVAVVVLPRLFDEYTIEVELVVVVLIVVALVLLEVGGHFELHEESGENVARCRIWIW